MARTAEQQIIFSRLCLPAQTIEFARSLPLMPTNDHSGSASGMKSICILLQGPYDIDMRVRRKAETLVAAGYSVDVLALRAPKGQKTYMLVGVRVHTLPLGKKRGSLLRYAFEYAAFFLWAFVRVTLQMPFRR